LLPVQLPTGLHARNFTIEGIPMNSAKINIALHYNVKEAIRNLKNNKVAGTD